MQRLATVVAMVALAGAGVFAQKPAAGDEAAIGKVRTAFQNAVLASDTAGLAKLFAADGIEMPPNAPEAKGRAAIEAYHTTFGKQMMIHGMTITSAETHVTGDRAYDVGTYTQQIMPIATGGIVNDRGKYIVLLKKVGGAWEITHAIYNSDLPVAPPKK